MLGSMPKVWKIAPRQHKDILEQLLINRGITKQKEKEDFLNPKLDEFEKDLAIPFIKKAQERIYKAIDNQELIIIFGDYDVDGICASTIMYKALTSIGAKVIPYIPHREKEGYGLNKLGLEYARDSGATLVITVDNGIVAIEQAKFASEIGLDLIITDHHLPLETKPEALAIVHSTVICGAAVAWCLVRSMVSKKLAQDLLQFAGIATICDHMSLVGVNRSLVREGLKVLNSTTNVGLISLFSECKLEIGEINAYAIGHIIGPRLNAIGRLEHAIDAVRLLCTQDMMRAKKLATMLTETNIRRKTLTESAMLDAKSLVDEKSKINILYSENWSQGIIGLVAARVCEETAKPTIAISVGTDIAKGSARSVNGLNIVDVIRQASDLLVDIGGHSGAAGFSLVPSKVEEFKQKVEEIMMTLPEGEPPCLELEMEISSNEITKKLQKRIAQMEPFGYGNEKPLFATRAMVVSDIRVLSEGKHLKFKADGIDAIAFGLGNLSPMINEGSMINVAYYLELNRFNGRENIQLMVKDIHFNEDDILIEEESKDI